MLLTHPDLPKKTFQFTFPARGTTRDAEIKAEDAEISIHVPREGNDAEDRGGRQEHHHFNPRSPRGERRKTPWAITSTGNFNPRSPRGERPFRITAYLSPELFQSTFPARGTTQHSCKAGTTPKISIHVPREGNDLGAYSSIRYGFHFNPRSPRGERPVHNCRPNDLVLFQSTFPARGTTHVAIVFVGLLPFQSTFPARGTTVEIRAFNYNRVISIHVPREGNDMDYQPHNSDHIISIHVPREGNDPYAQPIF